MKSEDYYESLSDALSIARAEHDEERSMLLAKIERLKAENERLKDENERMKAELLKKEKKND